LDGGPCRIGLESTVVSFVDSPDGCPTLLRPGGITREEIERVVGTLKIRMHEESQPASPGQLLRHYAPETRLVVSADAIPTGANAAKVGLLSFQRPASADGFAATEVLSEQGCLREAAANLFAALRRLDALGLDFIVARPVPEVELGHAIMDRLRRAAAR
jgi:L-threonylcarbamoyladenylate synthase